MTYSVFTLPLESALAAWVAEVGIEVPHIGSRYPTPSELRTAIASLPRHSVEYAMAEGNGFQARVSGPGGEPWTTVAMCSADDAEAPRPFSFNHGLPELVLAIVERVTHVCGPLLVCTFEVSPPILVAAGMNVEDAMRIWRRPQRREP